MRKNNFLGKKGTFFSSAIPLKYCVYLFFFFDNVTFYMVEQESLRSFSIVIGLIGDGTLICC